MARWAAQARAGGGRLVLLVLAVVALLAGCGGPEYTYVTNSEDRTYLRIPHSWQPIDGRELSEAIGLDPSRDDREQGFWLAAYDADPKPSTDHLLGPHSASPALIVGVRHVPMAARGQVSLDGMRDMFWPVSPSAREQAAANPFAQFSSFGLISDEVLTPGEGLRGVHTVYRYRIEGGPAQIFDQTVYVNDDASKLYIFYIRCSSECYEQRRQEIENVVSSFTVRETP
jgi:hypothetical protein